LARFGCVAAEKVLRQRAGFFLAETLTNALIMPATIPCPMQVCRLSKQRLPVFGATR
jgi:hypothetical protein